MKSRFLAELTTPEVEEYLAGQHTTALLPVGCVEMHGPHQPIGTDSIIAKAFCLRIADEADGLVLPELHYTWAGSTDGFAGTISIEPELVQKTVESIAVKVQAMGFGRMLVVSVHHGNHYPLFLFVRRIYETHHMPAVYLNPFRPLSPDAEALFAGEYARSKEASLVLAALHVLGQGSLYSEQEMCYDQEPPPTSASFRKICDVGVVGYSMQDTTHHACPSTSVSLQRGLDYIEHQVRHILPILSAIDSYRDEIPRQRNTGWWR